MKLYSFIHPVTATTPEYTYAVRSGAWAHVKGPPGEGLCPACRTSNDGHVPPVIIEWDEGGVRPIGDFVTLYSSDMGITLVTRAVFDDLASQFRSCVQQALEIRESKKARTRKAHAADPLLVALTSDRTIDIDLSRSTVVVSAPCARCGLAQRTVTGFESWKRHLDPRPEKRRVDHIPSMLCVGRHRHTRHAPLYRLRRTRQ